MSHFFKTTVISFTLNIISLTAESLTLLISLYLLFLIIYYFRRLNSNHGQYIVSTPVILSINTLCLLIAKSFLQLMDVNLNTLGRDLNFISEQNDSFFCRLRGYIYFSVVSALYWSCALQAIFRLIRVLYSKYLWIHRRITYVYIFIVSSIIFAFLSVLPNLLFFDDSIHLIPNETYCTIVMNHFPSLLYLFLVVFGFPLGTIVICYICIIYKMRYSSFRRYYHQHNRRDYLVICRIMIVVVILNLASLPAIIDLIYYARQDHLDPLIYRIEWISASVTALVFAISIPFVNSQFLQLLRKKHVHRRRIIKLQTAKEIIMRQSARI